MLKYILKICEKIGFLIKCFWNVILWIMDKCILFYGFYNFIWSWVLFDIVKKIYCVVLLDNLWIWVLIFFVV